MQKVWKLIGFNIGFVILEVVLYSDGLCHLKSKPLPAFVVGVLSAAAFFGVNFLLLNHRQKSITSSLKDSGDYEAALRDWIKNGNPFRQQASTALEQLHQFQRKYNALKAITEEPDKENPFFSVSEDVQSCLLENSKKIINRMTVADPTDSSRVEEHRGYLQKILEQNREILSQYDNLLIEVSQIGDTRQAEYLNLEVITNTLRALRHEES